MDERAHRASPPNPVLTLWHSAAGQPRMPEASGIGDWGRSAKEAMALIPRHKKRCVR